MNSNRIHKQLPEQPAVAGAASGERGLTERQAAVIFDTLAEQADAAGKMIVQAIMAVGGGDEGAEAAQLLVAAETLLSTIGFLADRGSRLTGGVTLKGADPDAWFMPPSYCKPTEARIA